MTIPYVSEQEQERFDNRCFDAWMAKVDAHLEKRCGLSHLDLADYCYRDEYDDGASPAEAARGALRAEGYFG